jgi:hypothetical protein
MINRFIQTLPFIAQILGQKYGVKVIIGGEQAFTNGKDIYLPSLPLNSPILTTNLARGYIDHEAAHIRHTPFDEKMFKIPPLEKHFLNTIEDFRVEKIFGEQYPGCKANFEWLILHFFDKDVDETISNFQDPTDIIPIYALLRVRSFSVEKLEDKADKLREKMDVDFPEISKLIDPILENVRLNCVTGDDSLKYAKEIYDAISKYSEIVKNLNERTDKKFTISELTAAAVSSSTPLSNGISKKDLRNVIEDAPSSESQNISDSASSPLDKDKLNDLSNSLSSLLKAKSNLPATFKSRLKSELNKVGKSNNDDFLRIAVEIEQKVRELSADDILKTKRISSVMGYQLQSVLQSSTLTRYMPSYNGNLDVKLLHRLSVNSPRIFKKTGIRRSDLNTAVHLLIDTSFSMSSYIKLTSLTAYSICKCLSDIPGISVGATTFPGDSLARARSDNSKHEIFSINMRNVTVFPLLKHNEPMHKRFSLVSSGNTPMAEALWWVFQKTLTLGETRKIIIIITDGQPNSESNFKCALAETIRNGIEIYGLAINDDELLQYLPGRAVYISDISELPRKLFDLLRKTLPKNN